MSLGWQVILAFLFGIILVIILFLIIFRIVKWTITITGKTISTNAKKEITNVEKQIKSHFGVQDKTESRDRKID